MNNDLKNIIEKVKLELKKDFSLIVAGDLEDGIEEKIINDEENAQEYYDFLKECNGARCGAIDIFSDKIFSESQYRVERIPEGKDKWLCIGQIIYEPMVLNKEDGKIYLYFQGNEKELPPKCFTTFDNFLLNYVFGKNYSNIIPDANNDEWYKFLRNQILIT